MKLIYFAWVRERVGKGEEDLDLPAEVVTVADLIAWLSTQGEGYAYAFEKPSTVRAALDKVHARHETAISGAREVAFFPPMTGG
jgi:sulfur-carrier protein